MSDIDRHDAVELIEPQMDGPAVVFDSPHSGTLYPSDFAHVVDPFLLQGGEDRFVDDLIVRAPRNGIALIRALFARTYIDPNRAVDDLDPELLKDQWPEAMAPSTHSMRGLGLVFRLIGDGESIYDRKLDSSEIRHRIENYWQPYHRCLEDRVDMLHQRDGVVWHINWHSMGSVGNMLSPDTGAVRADFVLGDLHGRSCNAELTTFVATALEGLGYSVAINDPYAGAYIVARHGRPEDNRHSLQIEINRGLYMNEVTLEPTDGIVQLRDDLERFTIGLVDWARERQSAQSAQSTVE